MQSISLLKLIYSFNAMTGQDSADVLLRLLPLSDQPCTTTPEYSTLTLIYNISGSSLPTEKRTPLFNNPYKNIGDLV